MSSDTYRLGARHAVSAGSMILVSGTYRQGDGGFADAASAATIVSEGDEIGGEVQHLFRSRLVDVVSGAGYFDVGGETRTSFPFGTSEVSEDTRHANAYVYAHLRPVRPLTLTLGASADSFESDANGDRTQLNPKLGVMWSPFPGTSVRMAAFRVLQRTLPADQTLEPTQVAGFNQLFDESGGTRSWRYGVGVHQKLSYRLSGGVEGTRRDLTVPFTYLSMLDPAAGPQLKDADWKEYAARAYVFWTPFDWAAVRAEYFFERLIHPEEFTLGIRTGNTHRVPVGLAVFHGTGMGASATATYCHQSGTFGDLWPGFSEATERFVVLDAALTWRLPRRYGLVTVGATNLLDEDFRLFENGMTAGNPTVLPARAVFARLTLAVP